MQLEYPKTQVTRPFSKRRPGPVCEQKPRVCRVYSRCHTVHRAEKRTKKESNKYVAKYLKQIKLKIPNKFLEK